MSKKFSFSDKNIDSSSFECSCERVLLLMLTSSDTKYNIRCLDELKDLAIAAGVMPVAFISQSKSSFNSNTIWGKGKLQEVASEVLRNSISLVIADRDLTPSQVRNLEKILFCPVMDRTELILDIFAQRASSSAGRIQVEIAQLRYRLPRLIGRGHTLSRQGSGIGARGPGEKKLEQDRRVIARRIGRLNSDVVQLERHRNRIRKYNPDVPHVALVGYTNVGKSTFLNSLCKLSSGNKVFVQNQLFATLDPTTRRLFIPFSGKPSKHLMVTDTVGFIRDLPDALMEAFKSTLEDTVHADLLLILVDLSNPYWKDQLETVNQLLNSLDAKGYRKIVANKIDKCESAEIKSILEIDPNALYVSATSGAGLQALKNWLKNYFWPNKS